MSDEVLKRTICIVGKTGNGKSATGNTLLDRTAFIAGKGADAVTKEIKLATCNRGVDTCNLFLTVIDTPGLFDREILAHKALQLLKAIHWEPHVFLVVLKEGRITDEDQYTVDMLRIIFGEGLFKHAIVVVTHGTNFDNDAEFQQFVANQHVRQLIDLCGNRVMKIDNKARDFNILEFLQHVKDLHSVYKHKHWQIQKSVIEKFVHLEENHVYKPVDKQLQEMSNELKRQLPSWNWKLIGGGVAALGLLAVAVIFDEGNDTATSVQVDADLTNNAVGGAVQVGQAVVSGALEKLIGSASDLGDPGSIPVPGSL